MDVVFVIVGWVLAIGAIYLVAQRWLLAQQARARIFEAEAGAAVPVREDDFLTHWLSLAGNRSPNAARTFVVLSLAGLAVGGLAAYLLYAGGILRRMERAIGEVPGGVGDLFLPLVFVAPWFVLFLFTAAPWLVVRSARRRRVVAIEEDLPLMLELLATLGEAGLGFDSALQRILGAQSVDRPLLVELRTFQIDLLAGQGRVNSLRRLARRVEVLPFTLFISALVQVEQTGAGVATVLRRQADDLRDRRREQAIGFAMALPVKLLFPLVICFLPGLFVATLGPTFYQFFQFADSLLRDRGAVP